jgi:hypothetical protein
MANRRRGEVEATIAGTRYTLCLTLGSLAELEQAFGVADLGALSERFGHGRLGAEDLVKLLGAGLRGGGHAISDEQVREWPLVGSLAEIGSALSDLLEATFGEPSANPPVQRA